MEPTQPHILLVDDNELNLFLLVDMIQELEATAIIAESGVDALGLAEKQSFAAILVAVDMKDMSGYQLLNRLSANKASSETPVLLLLPTLGYKHGEFGDSQLNPADVIHTPINKRSLQNKLRWILIQHKKFSTLNDYYSNKLKNESERSEGFLALNKQGMIVHANPSAVSMLRTRLTDLVNLYFESILERKSQQLFSNWQQSVLFQSCAQNKTTKVPVVKFYCSDGSSLDVKLMAYPLHSKREGFDEVHTLVVFQQPDNALIDKLQPILPSEVDPLTKLTTRDSFEETLQLSIDNADGSITAMLLLNLDHFDYVNESLGQEAGNKILLAIAQRLTNCIPPHAKLSRMNGDEFAILLPPASMERAAIITAHALRVVFKESFLIDGNEVYVSASIGIASAPRDGNTAKRILRNADRALKKAKLNGSNSVESYNSEMILSQVANFEKEAELRHVIANHEFLIKFSPIRHIKTKQLSGVQAKLFWNSKSNGLLDIDAFQQLAEESGLMPEISQWFLLNAAKQFQAGLGSKQRFSLRLNIPISHLLHKNFESNLQKVLEQTSIESNVVELEFSESELGKDNAVDLVSRLGLIHGMGFKLVLDDFGSNYLALANQGAVCFQSVKLGKQFLRSTLGASGSDVILKSVIDIAHQYGAEVVAVGDVEGENLEQLLNLGCEKRLYSDLEVDFSGISGLS